jgi:Flp pilus assembly protein TadG
MALVLPLLLMITFGAVEYGYAMFIKHTLQSAAREGARAAIVQGADQNAVMTAVDNAMNVAGFAPAKYTRPATIEMQQQGTTTWSTAWGSAVAGDSIKVTVQTTWGTAGISVLPGWLGGIPTTKPLSGATTMRKEG